MEIRKNRKLGKASPPSPLTENKLTFSFQNIGHLFKKVKYVK